MIGTNLYFKVKIGSFLKLLVTESMKLWKREVQYSVVKKRGSIFSGSTVDLKVIFNSSELLSRIILALMIEIASFLTTFIKKVSCKR